MSDAKRALFFFFTLPVLGDWHPGCSLWSGATLHRLNVRLNERTRVQT